MRSLQLSLSLVLGCGSVLHAQTAPNVVAQDLKRLSIEELAQVDVTSVSRRVERLSQTAAAVSVIRQDDIRRTGAISLAEAMRLGDAIDVARYDGRTWAVSARGFNISTANKLLILMDGRSLYSPLFAGTFWDVQDTLLADIDRIEVIRGPGGAVWGANAMNGVINIITTEASSSRGNAAFLIVGNEERVVASARHGGRMGESGNYRVFGKYRRRDANVFPTGASAEDDLQLGQAGFRLDSNDLASTRWTLQGDAYGGTEGLFNHDDTDVAGGNVLGRWQKQYGPNSDLQVQAYYDRTYRRVPQQFEETRDTFDVDVQRRFLLGRHDIIVGGDFLVSTGRDVGTAGFRFEPERQTDKLFSLFAQDEFSLTPGQVFLTIGSKFERNDFTGFDVQPTIRARWSGSDRQTVWGAVSRAVRLPTRFDTGLRLINPATGAILLSGNEDFDTESVVAYEAGYRIRPHARVSLDFATFVNRYDNLRSQEFPAPQGPFVLLGNTLNAVTSGFEAAGTMQLASRWRVHGSYAYLHKAFSNDPGSRDLSRGRDEANDPSFLFSMRSYLDLPHGLALDGLVRAAGERPYPAVAAYAEFDLRLGWTARPGWELSIVGQNLLHDHHPELGSNQLLRYEFQRGVYLRTAWRF